MDSQEIDLKRRIQRVRDSIRKEFGILKRQRVDVKREFYDTYRPITEPLTDGTGQTVDFYYGIHYDSHNNSWAMGSSSVIDNKGTACMSKYSSYEGKIYSMRKIGAKLRHLVTRCHTFTSLKVSDNSSRLKVRNESIKLLLNLEDLIRDRAKSFKIPPKGTVLNEDDLVNLIIFDDDDVDCGTLHSTHYHELPHLVEHNLLITFKYYLLPPAQDLYTYIKTDRSESHLNIYNSCIVVNNFIKTMDSIPTSCVQLAKEQIIKYSDPKYNINDLKTGDCETMLLNQTIYYLNKSKSKWISVGLYYPFEFASVVKIFGRSKQYVIFKEEEWIQFHEQRENINKYFQTFDTMWKPRQIGSKTLTFEMIEEKKILKIEDMSGNEVYLGWESVSEVWSLESVLRYRLSYSSGSNFKYFYEDVIRAVAEMSGDVKINIYNIINRLSEKSDDVCCMLEVLLFMPEKALFDVQLERRIQEQGLYYPFEFASVVKIFGRSKQYVIFKEEEWIQFHEQRENINKYFQTFDTMWKPRQIGSKTLTFEMIEEKKILKIEDMSGNEVYLGWESVSEVWSLESVLRYRLSYSSGSNFKYFYEDVIRAVAEMSGDVKINIYNIINRLSEKSDDVCCMLEVLLFMPEKALFDVQLERRIQEQGQKRVKKHLLKKMWMLYAQEHWTKCYDLKSAVERLYEELGALEFDADHEAIYGMERYYTVQQCEELRDKYKIEDMSGNEVYLGWESVSEVWSLESVLRYRLSYSSGSNFKYFYEDVIRAVAEMSGDVKINIYNIINRLSEKSDDVCCMLEVLLFMPEKALFDVQLERRIQEQGQKRVKKHLLKKMWMLYAQEHWTKCYDLKSAVERLYEELGALEFDADHEAIYGMERYYTVQQCEELRDKYKIGRKVCRKFLQGRTCSQCLVKRISEIGLRHFLDTVNKYIKDCSDSSSSSDEEVFKAVEQNGEETTEEEEESKKSESESVTKLV
ncbi:hypothetical protein FQA39_LY17437 [Lamprigera yunnana]|nr:hypothetical protein FQA39_LY17437 [Lamprigera yunnana]